MKEIKGIQIGTIDVKVPLFTDDRMLYTRDPKDSTRKPQQINTFSKAFGLQNCHTKPSLDTNDKHMEKETRETIPFSIASKALE